MECVHGISILDETWGRIDVRWMCVGCAVEDEGMVREGGDFWVVDCRESWIVGGLAVVF